MRNEMDSLAKNKVCELIDHPPQRKSIGNKFKIKCQVVRSSNRFKDHPVEKDFT